jgi:serine protease Do
MEARGLVARTSIALLGAALLLGAGACGKKDDGGTAASASASVVTAPPPLPTTPPPMPTLANGAPMSFAPIVKTANPAVVTINTVGEEVVSGWGGKTRRRQAQGLGTGFLIDKDGTILTNNHVVSQSDGNVAGQISVKLSDDREISATVIGRDPPTDIAVVRIDMKGVSIEPLPLGDSDVIEVGDWVVAIGNPFGLEHTVSAGIVSAKGRTKEDVPLDPSGYYDFLQTDASINPGNSGGPLLNLKGEVVGINSAIRGGGAQGIGFAIPMNLVKQLLPTLLRDGKIVRSAIGVSIRDVRELTADERTELKVDGDKGAVIEYVAPGGPADKAGIVPGDVVVAFDGKPVDRGKDLQWMASTAGVGKNVTLKVNHQGKSSDLRVTLTVLPSSTHK